MDSLKILRNLSGKMLAVLGIVGLGFAPGAAAQAATSSSPSRLAAPPAFVARAFASGAHLEHQTPKGKQALSQPDDITFLGSDIFVGFQNGVGPQGQASTTGNLDSTVVAFDLDGHAIGQWDVVGKCDGLTADPQIGQVIATVNEDAKSSLYLINPFASRVVHYHYNKPLPSKGGTDAISIYHGMILISGSAPGTTGAPAPQPSYPAVYRAVLNPLTSIATVRPLFFDEAKTIANTNSPAFGAAVRLGLTDPDSNEVVPIFARRFAGDFMLTSQGDKEQIFVKNAGRPDQKLAVLKLSDSVDDTAWPSGPWGAIYTTDNSNNTIYQVTGPFQRGDVFVADTPCDANNAPSTCPAPGFPPNFLGKLNPRTGVITRVHLLGPAVAAQGMLYLPQPWG
jgi:hypothetical protein